MKFEDVLNNGKLWAVVYEEESVNILTKTITGWLDPIVLDRFFSENRKDLLTYYHIKNINQAIYDTIADSASLSSMLLDSKDKNDLDMLFRPLENTRVHEMLLSREKAKGKRISGHSSWLRIYALKLDSGIYLITGGAIKLTHKMNEREHTLKELHNIERVRNFLLDNNIIDAEGIKDYILEI